MIAITARTGSTNFCSNLAACCNVGEPTEIFNPRGVVQQLKSQRKTETFLNYLASFDNEPTDVFIFKTSWNDFVPFKSFHKQLFPNMSIIYLERRDIIAQAVSLFRAQLTNVWHLHNSTHIAPPAPLGDIRAHFDLLQIIKILGELETEKKYWEEFFSDQNLDIFRLIYENFSDDFVRAIAQVTKHLDIPIRKTPNENIGFRKLSDVVNEEWIHRVRCHLLRLT